VRRESDDREWIAFEDRSAFGKWLADNHSSSPGIWLVYHKNASPHQSITYDEAVEEALCFGWIDSQVKAVDDHRFRQKFTPRTRGSTWSKVNKERAARLIESGAMTPAGSEKIDAAKRDRFFDDLAPSKKKPTLWWVVSAKRPETRAGRIARIVERAAEGKTVQED